MIDFYKYFGFLQQSPGCHNCNWPQGGALGPIAISTREGIGDSGKQVPIPDKHTINCIKLSVRIPTHEASARE
jgi:hypothetical protein